MERQAWFVETLDRLGQSVKEHIKATNAPFTPAEMMGEVFNLGSRDGRWTMKDNQISLGAQGREAASGKK